MLIKGNTFGRFLFLFSVIPVLFVGVLLTVISTKTIDNQVTENAEDILRSTSKSLVMTYELLSEGKGGFNLDESGEVYLGYHKISGDYSIVDRLKEYSEADVTIFNKDVRVVTTIVTSDGERYVDSKATEIWEKYVSRGQDYFTVDMNILGVEYYAYYSPIIIDKKVIGMGFAGIPYEEIHYRMGELNRNSVRVCVVLLIELELFCILVTYRINDVQMQIVKYLNEIDEGNYNHELDAKVYKRKDEFGNMGRKLVKLNSSLDRLIRKDALTGLNNRRAAMMILSEYISCANRLDGESFCLAIGDIDFFKKVNDTYGHNCGDEVLKRVAKHIDCQKDEDGFAARWGGEEFVIAFKGGLENALDKLNVIAENIRTDEIEYGGEVVKITMTFGIVEYRPPKNLDELISNADVLLYKGKEGGRNRIVS